MTTIGISSAAAVPRTRTSWSRWAGISGILFGPVLAASVLMTAGMPQAKHAAKVQAWDIKHTGLLNGAVVATFAAVVIGLYFLTYLHSRLAGRDGGWMGTMYVVGTVVFAMSGALAAGVAEVTATDAKHLSTSSLQLMASVNQNFTYPVTSIGLVLLYLAMGYLIRRTEVLPGWLGWASWVFAFFAATFFLGFVAMFGSALFAIAAGIILTVRQPVES